MALKIIEIPYGERKKVFTGFVGGTDWPEFVNDRSRARLLSTSAANEAISRIRSRTGMKARAVTWTPPEETK